MWHGWLLEGSGSNVHTARLTERFRAVGHDVLLLCQERHPERFDFLDAAGSVGASGVGELRELAARPAPGRAVLLQPRIGELLPVFVYDHYEGFEVKRFLDLGEDELEAYLSRNVEAVREAARWHGSEASLFGHVVPGAVIARRALGPGRYAVKVHGSDLEYAVRPQERYRRLAQEGLTGAVAVTGPSRDSLDRAVSFVPAVGDRVQV